MGAFAFSYRPHYRFNSTLETMLSAAHTALPTNSPETREPALGRRQLLKAGAWGAPALVMTAAAPAASASHPDGPQLKFENFGPYLDQDQGQYVGVILNGRVFVDYAAPSQPVGNVTVTISLPAALFSTTSTVTFLSGSGSNWAKVGSGVLQGSVVTFTFISALNLTTTGPSDTGTYNVSFSSIEILAPGTIAVGGIALAPHAKSLAGELTITVPSS